LQVEQPLVHIPLDRVIPCELHALMRVTDRLTGGLIHEVRGSENSEDNERILCDLIHSITKVRFMVWTTKKGSSETIEWTDLTGYQKRALLEQLPEK
jgi:hypothetical protein